MASAGKFLVIQFNAIIYIIMMTLDFGAISARFSLDLKLSRGLRLIVLTNTNNGASVGQV
jgi:hypothetical protein